MHCLPSKLLPSTKAGIEPKLDALLLVCTWISTLLQFPHGSQYTLGCGTLYHAHWCLWCEDTQLTCAGACAPRCAVALAIRCAACPVRAGGGGGAFGAGSYSLR